MSRLYDSDLLRREAGRIEDVTDDMVTGVHKVYVMIGQTVQDCLAGDCAKAIEESVTDADSICNDCAKRLDEISRLLRHYAAQLDLADEKASNLIRER